MPPTRAARLVAWSYVAAQAILIAAIVLLPARHDWPLPTGVHSASWMLVWLALSLGIWAARWLGAGLSPSPLPNGRVGIITHGPYRWVRHPIYTAVVLGMVGVAAMSRSAIAAFLVVSLAALFAVKSRFEERHLAEAFPSYADYRRSTGRFIPGVGH
jgi:protein-S-isoprenylcysteine O-methyltransferase Ste14